MRVLLATDGSECSGTAIDLVANLPWAAGSIIRVLRAVEPYGGELGAWEFLAAGDIEQAQRAQIIAAEEHVEATASRFATMGLRTEHAVVRERAATAIVQDAERHRPDLVVVGSHGYSAIDRVLLGSVSAEVVDHSPVPVLVARRPRADRVVVAVDGSEIAYEALDTVGRWPTLALSTVTVVSVIPASAAWWRAIAAGERSAGLERSGAVTTSSVAAGFERFADDGAARLGAAGIGASVAVRSGPPAEEILALSRDLDADLIVLGSHGRTGLTRLVLGSVARSVLNRARCSVLVVPRHPETVAAREMVHALATSAAGA